MRMPRRILLINPPVYDTQYFARWSQPHGLLKIGSFLAKQGHELKLIDCLYPNSKGNVRSSILSVVKPGTNIEEFGRKRVKLAPGEKNKYYFGLPADELESHLEQMSKNVLFPADQFIPDEIWITSIMTYWWESTVDVVKMCKRVLPEAAIKVGGIYPTLCAGHLQRKLAPWEFKIVPGREFQVKTHAQVDCIVAGEIQEAIGQELHLDLYRGEGTLENALYEVKPNYCILTTSRGCPFNCSYCAQKSISPDRKGIWTRDAPQAFEEIYSKRMAGIREFCFYEDNLLAGANNFKQLLELIIHDRENKGLLRDIELNAPEGIEVRLLIRDPEIIRMMKAAGFQRVYLPLENIDPEINKQWNRSHARLQDFERAVNLCEAAGFKLRDMEVNAFILFGLPEENIQAVVDTVVYASQKVGAIIPMLFTPVPGTKIFAEYEDFFAERGFDLQHLNGKLYPFLPLNHERSHIMLQDYYDLESLMFRLNRKAKGGTFDVLGDDRVATTFRQCLAEEARL